jgi:hypothetical protein
MACDAQTLINTAYANGYAKLSERDLEACILASACAAGGGGGGAVTSGTGPPVGVPATGTGVYIDNTFPNNPSVWVYPSGGPWNEIVAGGP